MARRSWPGVGLGVRLLAALLLAGLVSTAGSALAYEFEVRARTVGQGYDLRSFRLSGPDLVIDRRRLTQTLSLSIFDIGDLRGPRRGGFLYQPYPASAPHVYFTSYLRLDHDFGAWGTGRLALDRLYEAVDLAPELESDLMSLDVLHAYVAAENLAGGWLDLYAGRQLDVETLDWWSMDGVRARARTGLGVAVEAFGGVRVRDASPAGSATFEPDGTGSAECAEYVEGAVPGSGAWRPIDRPTPMDNSLFTNDYDVCPQRDQPMPTFGGAIETTRWNSVWARLGYRRSMSPTPDLIGPADRFEHEDTGLYPDEVGQAPGWGANEEMIAATVRANLAFAGERGQVTPHAAGRYNLLLGTIDEAHAGVRVRYGSHSLEPEVYYSQPSFDGDSIFNVFAIQPYTDVRLTYDLRPAALPVSAFARAWARRFHASDQGDDADEAGQTAAGVQLGTSYRPSRRAEARLDLFQDGGYGGQRTGGFGAGFWQVSERTGVRARASVIHFDEDLTENLRGTTFGFQAGATYFLNTGVTVHVVAEDNLNRFYDHQFRVLGVVDLAFVPEV